MKTRIMMAALGLALSAVISTAGALANRSRPALGAYKPIIPIQTEPVANAGNAVPVNVDASMAVSPEATKFFVINAADGSGVLTFDSTNGDMFFSKPNFMNEDQLWEISYVYGGRLILLTPRTPPENSGGRLASNPMGVPK